MAELGDVVTDPFAVELAAALAGQVESVVPAPAAAVEGGVGYRARSRRTPRPVGTKTCPGCGDGCLASSIACRRCWPRSPRTLRDSVVRAGDRDALAQGFAVRDVVAWLREHPR